jgi:hypothetical protein
MSDSLVYDQFAWKIASTGAYAWDNGNLTAYWPVGTPFIYSLPYKLFGHQFVSVATLNLFVGTATLALIMLVAHRWMSRPAALAAGIIYAFWPSQIEFTSILASELLFNFLLLLALWATFAAPLRSYTLKGLAAGAFLAAAAYVRPTALLLPLLLAAGTIWSRKADMRGTLTLTAAAFLAMAICIAPWALRNERVLGAPVLISTNGPTNLWMGNNPAATGAYMPLPSEVDGLSEVDRSRVLGARAESFILENPGRAATLFVRKLLITHDRETIGISWNETSLAPMLGIRGLIIAKALSTAYWWLALFLGLAGAVIVIARERWLGLIHPALFAWVYFAFVHAVTV